MKLNRKWILVMSLVLSLALATGSTLAYLTATHSVENTFTVGNVSIMVEEPSYLGNNQTLLPGVKIAKDPQIKNTGTTEAWVWMEITVPTSLMSYIDWNTTDWTTTEEVSGTNTVVTMKRADLLPAGDTTAKAFTKVDLPSTLESMPEGLGTDVNIVVQAFAIQDASFASIDAAIAAYGGAEGPSLHTVTVSNTDELKKAIEDGYKNITLKDGTYQLTDAAKGKTLTLNGTENAVIEHVNQGEDGMNYSLEGSTVVFNGVTIKTTSGTYRGFARSTAIEYNNCKFVGSYTLGAGSHTFNNCNFNLQNNYVWTWGGSKVVFNSCTFDDENGVAKAILVHNTVPTEVTVKNCTFNATTGANTWDGIQVAAVSIDPNGAHTAKVTFEGTNTVSEYFNGKYQIKYPEDDASLVTVVE